MFFFWDTLYNSLDIVPQSFQIFPAILIPLTNISYSKLFVIISYLPDLMFLTANNNDM